MKYLKYLMIVLILSSCYDTKQIITHKDLYSCGPNDMAYILIKSVICDEKMKCRNLYDQFNDSLKKLMLPISLVQVTCINESQQEVGLSFLKTVPEYIDIDLKEFWILINYDNDIGIHIDTATLRDSITKTFINIDNELLSLYDMVVSNPIIDSIARPQMLVSLNLKTREDNQISMDDYFELVKYIKVMTNISTKRVEKLSLKLWKKSYNELEFRQKQAVCKLVGYVFIINII